MTKTTLPVEREKRRGRPQYSGAVREGLIDALSIGMTRYSAAGQAGVHPSTFYDWIDKDEDFRRQVEEAEAAGAASYERTLAVLRGPKTPPSVRMRATEFYLSRRRPNEWREKSQVEVILPTEVTEARSRQVDDLRAELQALGEELLRRGATRTS